MRALLLALVAGCAEPGIDHDTAVDVAIANRHVWMIPVRPGELDPSMVLRDQDLARLCARQRDTASCDRFAGCEMAAIPCGPRPSMHSLGCDSIWVCRAK